MTDTAKGLGILTSCTGCSLGNPKPARSPIRNVPAGTTVMVGQVSQSVKVDPTSCAAAGETETVPQPAKGKPEASNSSASPNSQHAYHSQTISPLRNFERQRLQMADFVDLAGVDGPRAVIPFPEGLSREDGMMMGMQAAPERLFYDFCLEDHVPADHLSALDRWVSRSERAASDAQALLQLDRASLDRSGADDPDADRRLLLWASARSGGCARRFI